MTIICLFRMNMQHLENTKGSHVQAAAKLRMSCAMSAPHFFPGRVSFNIYQTIVGPGQQKRQVSQIPVHWTFPLAIWDGQRPGQDVTQYLAFP